MKHKKVYLFLAAVLAVLACSHLFGWASFFTGGRFWEELMELRNEHLAAAIVIYMACTVIGCVFLTLPGVTFAILAGLLFGPVLGTVCCAAAATAGAMASFLAGQIGRASCRERV